MSRAEHEMPPDEVADALKYLYWACQRLLEIVDTRDASPMRIDTMSREQRLAASVEANLEEVEQGLLRSGVELYTET